MKPAPPANPRKKNKKTTEWPPKLNSHNRGPPAGKVNIVAQRKGDSVYVDGGFAGVTGKLKKFPLRPGRHTIAFRDPSGHTFYQERIEVLMGKTIVIHPGLPHQNEG